MITSLSGFSWTTETPTGPTEYATSSAILYVPSTENNASDSVCVEVKGGVDECFKVTSGETPCFSIQAFYSDEEPVPDQIYIEGFSSIRDIIRHGITDLIVIGMFTPSGDIERAVVAKLTYTQNSTGDILNTHPVYGWVNLSNFDTFDAQEDPLITMNIDTCSLEAFNTSQGTSNFAIKTDTEIIYINPVSLSDISRTNDGGAYLYPFANTDDTYWTNTTYWDGSFYPASGVPSSIQQNNKISSLTDGGTQFHSPPQAFIDLVHQVEGRDYLMFGDDYTNIDQSWNGAGDGYTWIARVIVEFSVGADISDSIPIGYYTVSKKITDGSVVYESGLNKFDNNLQPVVPLPQPSEWLYTSSSTANVFHFSNLSHGQPAIDGPMPSEVDITQPFLNIRPDLAFGEGYIAVGERTTFPHVFTWLTVASPANNGYWVYKYSTAFEEYNYFRQFKFGTGYALYSNASVGNTQFIKVPFDPLNVSKVQVGGDWISMGIVAVDIEHLLYCDDLPQYAGNTGAIVGDRCLVPIGTPAPDGNGNVLVIDQTYRMSEHQQETREVIFE